MCSFYTCTYIVENVGDSRAQGAGVSLLVCLLVSPHENIEKLSVWPLRLPPKVFRKLKTSKPNNHENEQRAPKKSNDPSNKIFFSFLKQFE